MVAIDDCLEMINRKLGALELPGIPENLYDPIRYIIDIGGKRIRPALLLMAYNLFSEKLEDAIDPAIAIELFHNFTLMHDDIMDRSDFRRNKPTVHKKWNDNIALLSGDAMLIKAYQYLTKQKHERLFEMLTVFNKTAIEVCEGQQFDIDFETKNEVLIDEYLHMIELKTAVLLAASLKIGAICAGTSEDNANHLYRFGKNMGVAFQLQDDLLDVYGTLELFGKKPGNDIVANKKTFLLLTALKNADNEKRDILKYWLSNDNNAEKELKVKNITEIFNDLAIRDITEKKINEYYLTGLEELGNVKCPEIKKEPLIRFAENLMNREK
jgi:geranylgeranyl diphosphate synthase type II